MFPHRDGSVDHFVRSLDHLAGQCLLLFSLLQPWTEFLVDVCVLVFSRRGVLSGWWSSSGWGTSSLPRHTGLL